MFCSTLFVVSRGDLIAKLGEDPAKGQTFRVFSLPAATPLRYGVTVIQGWRPHCQCGIYLVLTAHWHIQGADTLFPKKGSQLPNLSCAKAPQSENRQPQKTLESFAKTIQDSKISKWYSWARFERCWCLSTLINTHIFYKHKNSMGLRSQLGSFTSGLKFSLFGEPMPWNFFSATTAVFLPTPA